MTRNLQAILSLIATGKITPQEAERLLAVNNEARETAWIAGACVLLAALAELHGSGWLPGSLHVVGQGLRWVGHWWGGLA